MRSEASTSLSKRSRAERTASSTIRVDHLVPEALTGGREARAAPELAGRSCSRKPRGGPAVKLTRASRSVEFASGPSPRFSIRSSTSTSSAVVSSMSNGSSPSRHDMCELFSESRARPPRLTLTASPLQAEALARRPCASRAKTFVRSVTPAAVRSGAPAASAVPPSSRTQRNSVGAPRQPRSGGGCNLAACRGRLPPASM
mmetsp:Transcript_42629/g.118703  ORF Transcript_42629/g.118703 Transcript_42629/m.118703 type:complete len:201 (+) Transcript_42629:647-1249(+)